MSKTESKTESFLLQTDVCTKRKKPRKQLNGYNPVAVWCEVARRKLHVPIGVTGVETKLLTELGNMYNEKELRAMIAQYALSKPDSNARWNLQWEFHKDHLHWRRKAGAMDAPVDLGNEDRLEQLYGANSGARIEIPLEMKA